MTTHAKPLIRPLTENQAQALLARNWVGRIAYAFHDRVGIEPIHYVYEAPWIYARTSIGAKVLTLTHNAWCAFETDEVHSKFDWESVVVTGPFSARSPDLDRAAYDRAVAALRRLIPEALTPDDPTPQRDIVFGVHATEISGRSSIANGGLGVIRD